MNRQYVTGYDFDADSGLLTFCDSVVEPEGVMTVISWSQARFKDKIVKEKLIEMGWTPPDGSVSWIERDNTEAWESGALGRSAEHAKRAPKELERQIKEALQEKTMTNVTDRPAFGIWADKLDETTLDDKIIKALKQAYSLGQVYWQQADSEYSSQWKKADATEAKFDKLVEEVEQLLKES
jgi:hypothetical protein